MDDLAESARDAEATSVSHTSSSTHLLLAPENSKRFAEEDLLLQNCTDTFQVYLSLPMLH